ncbi:hypothetical protein PM082_003546 [Marasmius tenuissimus]|nr:hypothetical protein PM082_003546 [Marasmius tenuissimus]
MLRKAILSIDALTIWTDLSLSMQRIAQLEGEQHTSPPNPSKCGWEALYQSCCWRKFLQGDESEEHCPPLTNGRDDRVTTALVVQVSVHLAIAEHVRRLKKTYRGSGRQAHRHVVP